MLKDLLRYRISAVRLGLFFVASLLAFLVVAFMINRAFSLTFWDKGYELKADFVDADGIANASDVRIAGSYVGQVSEIRSVRGGLAEITFRVEPKYSPLHVGTRANLRLATLLGTKYVEVVPGAASGPAIPVGTVIPATQTQSPVDFDQILQSFDAPTRQNLAQLVKEAGIATDGRGEDLNALLSALHSLSVNSVPPLAAVSDREPNLDKIVAGLDDVAGNLATERAHLANVNTHLNTVLLTIAENDTAFRRFLHEGNISLGHGLAQFQGEGANLNATLANLRPAADKLGPTLNDIYGLAKSFNRFVKISDNLILDIFSAVSDYNHNPQNNNYGGFFLRQPSVLSPTQTFDQEHTGSPLAAGTQGAGPAGAGGPLNLLPGLVLPGDLLPGIPGLTAPTSSGAARADAEATLLRWLLR